MMDIRSHLLLRSFSRPVSAEIDQHFPNFIETLEILRLAEPTLDVDWIVQFSEHSPVLHYSHDAALIEQAFMERLSDADRAESDMARLRSLWAVSADPGRMSLTTRWGMATINSTYLEIHRIAGAILSTSDSFISLIQNFLNRDTLHITLSPQYYITDHHPLDRSRVGIGWMGWVPFALTARDVPDADLVRPLGRGTLIVPHLPFWQSYEAHPFYSHEAIEKTQDVEIHLAQLGVLPTGEDLQSGNWPP